MKMTVFFYIPLTQQLTTKDNLCSVLLKLENEFKVASTALDCIIEDITTLLDNKIDSLHNELVAKLSQKNIVF